MAATKKCSECGKELPCGAHVSALTNNNFLPTKSFLFDGYLPICNNCLAKRINPLMVNQEQILKVGDKFSQLIDVPFNPDLWVRMNKIHGAKGFVMYAVTIQTEEEYLAADWSTTNKKYLAMEQQELDDELPELKSARLKEIREKWNGNYSEEELQYLENLLQGIIKTQDVSSAKSYDEAKKLCKVSLMIESRIRAGDEFDKLLASYEKLTKVADFTPKNSKNAGDFNSVGELVAWLEKRGWVNEFYDGANRDVVDSTIKNFQSYVRNLYVNETNISEEIDRRLAALERIDKVENAYYDELDVDYDKDEIAAYATDDIEEEEFEEDPRYDC